MQKRRLPESGRQAGATYQSDAAYQADSAYRADSADRARAAYQDDAARERATAAFKRAIIEGTRAIEAGPEADLFRVNLLGRMLDRYDILLASGASADLAQRHVLYEFDDLAARMEAQGFRRAEPRAASGAYQDADAAWPQLTDAQADEYIAQSDAYHKRCAKGAGVLSACCMPLFIGVSFSELGYAPNFSEVAAMFGLMGMFAEIGYGVYLCATAKKPKLHDAVNRRRFALGGRLRRRLERMRETVEDAARGRKGLGIAMLVACVIPLFAGVAGDMLMGSDGFWSLLGLSGMFGMIGVGVYELTLANGERKAFRRLLKEKKK